MKRKTNFFSFTLTKKREGGEKKNPPLRHAHSKNLEKPSKNHLDPIHTLFVYSLQNTLAVFSDITKRNRRTVARDNLEKPYLRRRERDACEFYVRT